MTLQIQITNESSLEKPSVFQCEGTESPESQRERPLETHPIKVPMLLSRFSSPTNHKLSLLG